MEEGLTISKNSISSPSISLDQLSRQSIVEVIFSLDVNVVNWIGSTFYDSHTSKLENGNTVLVPNSEFYKCPKCNAVKSANTDIVKLYAECNGDGKKPHERTPTEPLNWRPLLTKAGINYTLGEIYAFVNANIQTGNFGKSENDVKKKAQMEDRLLGTAFDKSLYVMASILDDKTRCIASWLLVDGGKELPKVFNIGFLTATLINMTYNNLASLTKGRDMSAVSKILESRSHIEQEIRNVSERQETQQEIQKKGWGILGNIFQPKKD